MKCYKCNDELIESNWYPSHKSKNHCVCIPCCRIEQKTYENGKGRDRRRDYNKNNKDRITKLYNEWLLKNKDKRTEYTKEFNRKYYQEHKEEAKSKQKQYYKENIEEVREKKKQYHKTPKGKLVNKKHIYKRRNELGYIVLNEWDICIPSYVGHHLDRDNVLYIPEELHKVYHSQKNKVSMYEINEKLYCWYYTQWFLLYYYKI